MVSYEYKDSHDKYDSLIIILALSWESQYLEIWFYNEMRLWFDVLQWSSTINKLSEMILQKHISCSPHLKYGIYFHDVLSSDTVVQD